MHALSHVKDIRINISTKTPSTQAGHIISKLVNKANLIFTQFFRDPVQAEGKFLDLDDKVVRE